ncbi:lysophospholipid acyltransferase family protein [Legionella fallonii]|uniref:Putative lipid A biosynthesis acyltransferase n=1 Tax=Legionella fallonii LLAP-10 TaxID=1212491 RepID=A0A098GC28_9GAMM|nr:lysophospholipid acyltransferase family protein [Legionella fallonii]CEG59041.1 Putative lipid A biosynthesis acyltransferase [Legionella fallonii LLAP-10]
MVELQRDISTLQVTWLGRCVYFLSFFRNNQARNNIARVFGQILSPSAKKRLAMAYFSHLMTSLKEIFLFTWISNKRLAKRVQFIGIEHLHQATNEGKGVILLTGHFGSWEFAPLFFLVRAPQYTNRYYCVRKSLRFTFLDNILLRRYENAGCQIINKKNAVRRIYSVLQKQGVVLFPFDLRPAYHTKNKLRVNFLGQETSTYTSLAFLVDKLQSPVVPVTSYRLNKKHHVIEFYPEIEWEPYADKEQAFLHNTQRYNNRLEDMLLANPAQWLWSYKRWQE